MNRFKCVLLFCWAGIAVNADTVSDVALDVLLARDVWAAVGGLGSDAGTWSVVEVRTDAMPGTKKEWFQAWITPPYELSARFKGRGVMVAMGEMRTLWRGTHVEGGAAARLFQVPFPGPEAYFDETMKPLKWRYSRMQPDAILFVGSGVARTAFLKEPVKTVMQNEYEVIVDLPRVHGVPDRWRKEAIEFAEWVGAYGGRSSAWDLGEAEGLKGNPLMRLAQWREVLRKTAGEGAVSYPADMRAMDVGLQAAMMFGVMRSLEDPVARRRHAKAMDALVSEGVIDRYAWGVATVAHIVFVEGSGGVDTELRAALRVAEERAAGAEKLRWKELVEVVDDFAGGRAELMSGRTRERR